MRKWREHEEMERKWGNGERFTLYISSFSLYFIPLYPFPISKFVTFRHKKLITAFLSRISQKLNIRARQEEIILGRICCEEAPQVEPAWLTYSYRKDRQGPSLGATNNQYTKTSVKDADICGFEAQVGKNTVVSQPVRSSWTGVLIHSPLKQIIAGFANVIDLDTVWYFTWVLKSFFARQK